MKLVIAAIAFLASGMVLAAQQTGSGNIPGPAEQQSRHIPPMQISPVPIPMGCPVQLHAQHGTARGSMDEVGTAKPDARGQSLHLTLTNPPPKHIVAAKVRIHGASSKPRIDQTDAADSSDSARSMTGSMRTMDVSFKDSLGRQVSSDLWVPGMTAVLKVDLTEVTFADGDVWKLTKGCQFNADPLMLVSSH